MVPPVVEEYIRKAHVQVDPETYALLRLSDDASVDPQLAARSLAWLRAPGDQTLVVPLKDVRGTATLPGQLDRDDGWRRITLGVEVPLDQPGFLRYFADELAKEKISLLPLAGYRYDHLLVHEVNLERAVDAIERVRKTVAAAVRRAP
jgi:hypothetical protein